MSNLFEIADHEASVVAEASKLSPAVHSYLAQNPSTDFFEKIRYSRNQNWVRAAIASLRGHDPQEVCRFWSDVADNLLTTAFHEAFAGQAIGLFALGKLGSRELNLSSDVDILLVSEEGVLWQSGLRKFQKLLDERSSYGFVFRLDFDLRPGGRNGPLVPTLEQFRDYYGNYGETWERLAFVRLRFIAGNADIKDNVLSFSKKFTFRKHLDFTLLEDLKRLRQKIHAHYWARTQENQIDLKLGIGGIRDVELFVHALQVVHGGKDKSLQIDSTHTALDLISEKNLLPFSDVQFLQRHYWNLRKIENYVQAINDEQTHLLKIDKPVPDFISKLLPSLEAQMKKCDTLVSGLLGVAAEASEHSLDLKKLNVSDKVIAEYWQDILSQEALSHTKERDELSRKKFLDEFVLAVHSQQGEMDRAIILLKDFVKAIRAKATFFSMLLREKRLLNELAWLFGHSPYLARILCLRPELLDSFVYRSQDTVSDDWSLLLEELNEKKLLSEIINGIEFLRHREIQNLTQSLTSTADIIVYELLARLKKDFPSEIKILALGKWGGQEMGFNSDLDFIFVTPNDPTENDSKLSRRLISRLTDAHKGGAIYTIDMRLRPSGKAGPLVISEKNLHNYLSTQAAAWERQAYLKARWIGGEGFDVKALCVSKILRAEDLTELRRIQNELLSMHSGITPDLKYSPGGLVDIEFAVQIFCLQNQIAPQGPSTLHALEKLPPENFSTAQHSLPQIYLRMRQIEQMLQLVASEALTKLDQNHESFPFVTVALQTSPSEFIHELSLLFSESLQWLNRLDPRRASY